MMAGTGAAIHIEARGCHQARHGAERGRASVAGAGVAFARARVEGSALLGSAGRKDVTPVDGYAK